MKKTEKPTRHEAATVAIEKFGAPPEITDYFWVEAEVHGEVFMTVTFAESGTTGPLEHFDKTTYGTLSVGWDSQKRVAAYGWLPAEE